MLIGRVRGTAPRRDRIKNYIGGTGWFRRKNRYSMAGKWGKKEKKVTVKYMNNKMEKIQRTNIKRGN